MTSLLTEDDEKWLGRYDGESQQLRLGDPTPCSESLGFRALQAPKLLPDVGRSRTPMVQDQASPPLPDPRLLRRASSCTTVCRASRLVCRVKSRDKAKFSDDSGSNGDSLLTISFLPSPKLPELQSYHTLRPKLLHLPIQAWSHARLPIQYPTVVLQTPALAGMCYRHAPARFET